MLKVHTASGVMIHCINYVFIACTHLASEDFIEEEPDVKELDINCL